MYSVLLYSNGFFFKFFFLHFGGFDAHVVALVGVTVGQQFFAFTKKKKKYVHIFNIFIDVRAKTIQCYGEVCTV
jgi:hypothetical protein